MLLELVHDVAAAGEVADQDALAVADEFRLDVFVGGGILQDRADVHAALVGEGALADEGLVVAQRQIGQLAMKRQTLPGRRASPGRWWCGPA